MQALTSMNIQASLISLQRRKPTSQYTAKYNYTILERIHHLEILTPRDFTLPTDSNPSPYFVYTGPEFATMV